MNFLSFRVKFGERHRLDIRVDFLNLFNHMQFVVMNRNSFVVDYATFGIASVRAPPTDPIHAEVQFLANRAGIR